MDGLISRQAAIDALGEEPMVWHDNDDYALGERNQWNIDKLAIETAPSAQPEQRWIPCSERLPEKCGEYLVTREARGVYRYLDIVKKTNISGQIASDIIAWMPLPEPYWE